MIGNWIYAIVYFIIGSVLVLAVSNFIINQITFPYPGFNYFLVLFLVFIVTYTAWKKAKGEE